MGAIKQYMDLICETTRAEIETDKLERGTPLYHTIKSRVMLKLPYEIFSLGIENIEEIHKIIDKEMKKDFRFTSSKKRGT